MRSHRRVSVPRSPQPRAARPLCIWGLLFRSHLDRYAIWRGLSTAQVADTDWLISSFGEDESGEVYVVNHSGAIYRLFGGSAGGGPDAASWASGRLDLFSVGAGGDLGGVLISDPGSVSWGPNRLDVFARAGDNALWHIYWDGKVWSAWKSLGGGFSIGPNAASWEEGRLDVFAIGNDGALWHLSSSNKWSPWEPLGGTLTSAPGAVSWGPNRVDAFARGADGNIWRKLGRGQLGPHGRASTLK